MITNGQSVQETADLAKVNARILRNLGNKEEENSVWAHVKQFRLRNYQFASLQNKIKNENYLLNP